jgi:Ca2+:H+ antiporter
MGYRPCGTGAVKKAFVLTILMLFLEHVTAVTVSVKDKLTLSLGVAAGSSIVGLLIIYF